MLDSMRELVGIVGLVGPLVGTGVVGGLLVAWICWQLRK